MCRGFETDPVTIIRFTLPYYLLRSDLKNAKEKLEKEEEQNGEKKDLIDALAYGILRDDVDGQCFCGFLA